MQGPKSLKLLYSIMNLNTISKTNNRARKRTVKSTMMKLMSKYNNGAKVAIRGNKMGYKIVKNMMIKSIKIPQQTRVETKTKENEWKNNSLKIQS